MSIEVRGLSFHYKDFGLSVDGLAFESSKMTSIVGPNGAGKSTLLKCLAAVLPVSRRTLLLDGRDLASLKAADRARLVSYVPQEQSLALNYSAFDFVLMGRAPFISAFSVPSGEDAEAAREALHFVGLPGFEEREFSHLSSGERRLVLIARALAQRSDILLLDEPTTFLDPKHEIEIMDLCRKLADEKKKTLIITIHSLEMALRYSDFMVFMKNGRVIARGKPDDILSEELLENTYDLKMRVVACEGRRLVLR